MMMLEEPKTFAERFSEGKSIEDGVAGRTETYEYEFDRPAPKVRNRVHHGSWYEADDVYDDY
jgi:hypothetical protein